MVTLQPSAATVSIEKRNLTCIRLTAKRGKSNNIKTAKEKEKSDHTHQEKKEGTPSVRSKEAYKKTPSGRSLCCSSVREILEVRVRGG